MAKEQVREVQERRRSNATVPYSKSKPLTVQELIDEQLYEDDIPCGSWYCTKDGCTGVSDN